MLPAIGQGIVGIECVAGRDDILELVRPARARADAHVLDAERALSAGLGASCRAPIAGHATLNGREIRLAGLAGSPDGRRVIADHVSGAAGDAAKLGAELAKRLLAQGAGELLMSRLTGIGVLVTRPEHQASHLCQLIEAEGGAAVRYPALVIKPRRIARRCAPRSGPPTGTTSSCS
jgi:hypothetical protein